MVDRCRIEAHALGITPKISDAELVTLAVMQSLLGHTSERRRLRYARANLLRMFPDLPGQSGYNKRLRKLVDTMSPLVSMLGADTQIADDDLWVVDSTPVECGRSRETAKRSDVARMGRIRLLRLPLQILVGLRRRTITRRVTLRGIAAPPPVEGGTRARGQHVRGGVHDGDLYPPRPVQPAQQESLEMSVVKACAASLSVSDIVR